MTAVGDKYPKVLSIAGVDPSGGAGILADLKTFTVHGAYGMGVITALTAQNTQGVQNVFPTSAQAVQEQLDSIFDDIAIDAIKIGMLPNASVIAVVHEFLRKVRGERGARAGGSGGVADGAVRGGAGAGMLDERACTSPVIVLDPVMVATSGDNLLVDDSKQQLFDLIHLADIVTPNYFELCALTALTQVDDAPRRQLGTQGASVGVGAGAQAVYTSGKKTLESMQEMAVALAKRTGTWVLAKGGHLDGAGGATQGGAGADVAQTRALDLLITPAGVVEAKLQGEFISTHNTHGTGCALSAALAALRPQVGSWEVAATRAKSWLTEALRTGAALQIGQPGGSGPLNHLTGIT
jgi:hydroxymethylpyrimidine/phosphomethylpyrimidine kinase